MATVSVIVPTRNRPQFLEAALASIEIQRVPEIDVLVVDDASDRPDLTRAVADRFRDRLNIRYVLLDARGGPSRARNVGVRATQGDYVMFLDDDDRWHAGMVSRQLERFRTNPRRLANLGVVYVWHQWADATTHRVRRRRRPRIETLDDLFRWDYNIIPTVMIRRDCFARAGSFDETMPKENLDLHARLIQHCQFDAVEEILVTCRDHTGPRASDDAAARLRGLEMLLERYGALVRDPRVLHELRFSLGRHLLRMGDRRRARREFAVALATAPAARKPRYLVFWAMAAAGRGKSNRETESHAERSNA